jgi:predicted dehydrogenase
MGRAHSHAWRTVPQFFDVAYKPVLKLVCGQHRDSLDEFAAHWGWEETSTDWQQAVARPDIDIVDIAVPTWLHHPIVLEAARAGKHIFCEKPFALNTAQAREMAQAADAAGVVHYLNHNYRRCPAVALARQFIDQGKLGRIYHWRGAYLQSWIMSPEFPLTWQLRAETAGSGPHADLNSHSIDLARYLVGEIAEVQAMTASFIPDRPLPDVSAGAFQAGAQSAGRGPVSVEDAAFLVARFANGALGSFNATRFATGRKNFNHFEIYGSEGALTFNLERMNELEYFSNSDPAEAQGFRTILATEAEHPYAGKWWPPGHIIGYEHTFVHAMADFLEAVATGGAVQPNFHDGVREMMVLDAGLESARSGAKVIINEYGAHR